MSFRDRQQGWLCGINSGTSPRFRLDGFTVPMVLGTDLEGNGKARPIHLCDFASAGNTWNQAERYRVWLPKHGMSCVRL